NQLIYRFHRTPRLHRRPRIFPCIGGYTLRVLRIFHPISGFFISSMLVIGDNEQIPRAGDFFPPAWGMHPTRPRKLLSKGFAMIASKLTVQHLSLCSRIAARMTHLPGVATPDWCSSAARTFL